MATAALLIPRIIHRIWLGPDPMPDVFQRYGETWREHHPSWEMRLWTDDNLPELAQPEALERARHLAERANVLRYEVLRRFGGVYVDTDMECVRCIEPLLEGVEAFAGYQRPGEVCNAVLGAVPGHPAIERAVQLAGERVGQGRSSVAATGPGFITEVLESFPAVTIFERDRFYPYDWEEEPVGASQLPEAYAIHHWAQTGKEPLDLAARVEYTRERIEALRRRKVRADRRADRAERRAVELEARLAELEGTLWWRLRPARLALQLSRRRARR